jgi:RimJ/RimL family protein N-acetyltransferase
MRPTFVTERLSLVPAKAQHLDILTTLWRDLQSQGRTSSDKRLIPQQAALALTTCLALNDKGLGLWLLRPLQPQAGAAKWLGCVGLMSSNTAGRYVWSLRDLVEPFVALHMSAQGCGYASEALRALLGYGFRTLGLPAMAAVNEAGNKPTHRLLCRTGFEPLDGSHELRHSVKLYRLIKQQYLHGKSSV